MVTILIDKVENVKCDIDMEASTRSKKIATWYKLTV